MNFKPNGAATVIGSFPHEKAADACGLVFESLREIPAWPQLPRRSFLEDMNVQFCKRLPCLALNETDRKAGFDTSRDMAGELERFYTHFIEDDVDYFGLDDDHAAGFGCFIQGVRDGKGCRGACAEGRDNRAPDARAHDRRHRREVRAVQAGPLRRRGEKLHHERAVAGAYTQEILRSRSSCFLTSRRSP